jgi:hypothetical protein
MRCFQLIKFDAPPQPILYFKMRSHETLRIRTPAPDVQSEEYDDVSTIKAAETRGQHIPTIILAISITNYCVYIYNDSEINLYFAFITGLLWLGCLLDALNDKNLSIRAEYVDAHVESMV